MGIHIYSKEQKFFYIQVINLVITEWCGYVQNNYVQYYVFHFT